MGIFCVWRLRFALLGYEFGVWLGFGIRVHFWLEIDYRGEHKEHELLTKIMKK